jgi:hypothetical protein
MTTILTLLELLKAKDPDLLPNRCKLHFATTSGANPLDRFFAGTFKEWQEDQGHRNFGREYVIAVIQQHRAIWLFAGVWRVLGVGPRGPSAYKYETEAVSRFDSLAGRVMVEYEKKFRQSYPNAERCLPDMKVTQVLSERMSFREFPGIDSVSLSFDDLFLVVRQGLPGWKSPLSSFGGIYLITDMDSGKMYVGQAPGKGGIWQRWSEYAETRHGGNVELRALLDTHGPEHARRLRFVLLEIADPRTSKERLDERESYWKEALLTREFGFNRN